MPKSNRYDHVLRAVEATTTNSKAFKPYRVLHFGVGDGALALQLLDEAFRRGRPNIEYYGFDVFEMATPEYLQEEFLDVSPPSAAKVLTLLRSKTKAEISLNSVSAPVADLIIITGPRSLPSIRASFLFAKKHMHAKTVLLLDNYYQGDYEKGSAHLVDTHVSTLPGLDVQVRTPFDDENGRKTTMVWVRPTEWPLPGDQGYLLPAELEEIKHLPGKAQAKIEALEGARQNERTLSELIEDVKPNPGRAEHFESIKEKTNEAATAFPPGGGRDHPLVQESMKVEDQKFLDFVNKPAMPKEDAVKPAATAFPSEGGRDNPDLQPDGLRGGGGPDGAAESPADHGDSGGRRESGVEPEAVGEVPSGTAGDSSVSEERPQSDPVVELGPGGGQTTGDSVRGGDELGREVSPPVVGAAGDGSQPRGRKSRRSGNQRPWTPPSSAGEGAG
jgi:hypothetical protein